MLVVLGIIGLVFAMSLPMIIPMMRSRKIDGATEIVKNACLLARSKAIQQKRKMCVVLLEAERQVLVEDYDQLRSLLPIVPVDGSGSVGPGSGATTLVRQVPSSFPMTGYYVALTSGAGKGQMRLITFDNNTTITVDTQWADSLPSNNDTYVIGGTGNSRPLDYVCPHSIANYISADQRYAVLNAMAVERPQMLPEGCRFGCRFDLDGNPPDTQGFSYVFLPTGSALTLPAAATDDRNTWSVTTYGTGGVPSGPVIFGPDKRQNATIIVYAMTGQATAR